METQLERNKRMFDGDDKIEVVCQGCGSYMFFIEFGEWLQVGNCKYKHPWFFHKAPGRKAARLECAICGWQGLFDEGTLTRKYK